MGSSITHHINQTFHFSSLCLKLFWSEADVESDTVWALSWRDAAGEVLFGIPNDLAVSPNDSLTLATWN